jgi:hypothetical protein
MQMLWDAPVRGTPLFAAAPSGGMSRQIARMHALCETRHSIVVLGNLQHDPRPAGSDHRGCDDPGFFGTVSPVLRVVEKRHKRCLAQMVALQILFCSHAMADGLWRA